jgi:hypothetical protein
MLFERARAAAEKTQTLAATGGSPAKESGTTSSSPAPYGTNGPVPYNAGTASSYGTSPPSTAPYGAGSIYPRSNSTFPEDQRVASPVSAFSHGIGGLTPAGNKSGAELYAAGLAAMGRQTMYASLQPQASVTSPSPPRVATPPYDAPSGSAPGYGSSSTLGHSSPASKRFPSAAEEKAALAYMAAKQRVEQVRASESVHSDSYGTNGYNDIPASPGAVPGYDAIYGGPPKTVSPPPTRPLSIQRRTSSVSGSPPVTSASPPPFMSSDLPPGFTPNIGPAASALSALEEKARLRRQYEEQDAAAGSASRVSPTGPPSASPPPPAFQSQPSGHGLSAHDEKERMRLMYAEQDAAVRKNERRATTDSGRRAALPAPPVAFSPLPPAPGYAPNGVEPPPFAGGFINPSTFKPLSAAEEKARLRAQYEAEANGTAYSPGQGSAQEPPPPSFESHYQSRQNTLVPERSATLTPSNPSPNVGGAEVENRGLQRDPSISWGKRPATKTPVPEDQPAKSTFVPPPPPPPLMPVSNQNQF